MTITLHFVEGYGLKPGDAIRCRGIIVGQVRSVRLDADTGGVTVRAELQAEAGELARAGSRFWIARPLADFTGGVRGLETVVGAKYIVVLPGEGEPQTDFVALEAPPIPETIESSGLHVILQAHNLGGLRPGAPVTFRQVRVGSVLETVLASDASAVDVHVYIRPDYARLVRQNTEFWNVSGIRFQAGLRSGLAFSMESLESVLTGGVALATPTEFREEVEPGKRFDLLPDEPEGWQKWKPLLPITDARLPKETILPRPEPAVLQYVVPGYVWNSRVVRRGLVVPIGRDLLGPSDLLTVPEKTKGELNLTVQPPVTLNVETPAGKEPTITRWASALATARGTSPLLRPPTGPEESLLVGAPGQERRSVPVTRLKEKPDGKWEVDAAVLRDASWIEWHGAAVVAKDGRLIGLLLWPNPRKPAYVMPLDKKTAGASAIRQTS